VQDKAAGKCSVSCELTTAAESGDVRLRFGTGLNNVRKTAAKQQWSSINVTG
jgi:hypothetical protein